MSEKSLRLLEVRFRWAVVGLPAKRWDTVRIGEVGQDRRASNETLLAEEGDESQKRKYTKRARKLRT